MSKYVASLSFEFESEDDIDLENSAVFALMQNNGDLTINQVEKVSD